ncbi:MAG: ATP--guanido phosphotransferase [Oscillospiraceae bacterium]|jgi:protein arginine kinase|nr:ATP--guanido phosphotransferase [Oscillospiraceae bacterium]
MDNSAGGRRLTIDELMNGGKAVVCPVCGSNEDDVIESGRAGCSHCYKVFETLLAPRIEAAQQTSLPEPPAEFAEILRSDYPHYDDIAVSTRVRLARNLSVFPFPEVMTQKEAAEVFENITEFMGGIAGGSAFKIININESKSEKPFEAASLLERHLISKELLGKRTDSCGAAISADEHVSVMINEEDHLRIQSIREGLALRDCFEKVEKLEMMLSERFKFAYSDKLGWLTRCPTNLGTGIRASVMLHLPAHTDSGNIHRLSTELIRTGFTIRGFYGEGTKPIGRLYQISNQVTHGLSARQIVEHLNATVLRIIQREREIQRALDSNHPGFIEDHVWRAYGLLSAARNMGGNEAMQLLSIARVGVSIGELQIPYHSFNELLHRIQPNTICCGVGENLNEQELNRFRAKIIRDSLQNTKIQ